MYAFFTFVAFIFDSLLNPSAARRAYFMREGGHDGFIGAPGEAVRVHR
jgi:hypothetical protein